MYDSAVPIIFGDGTKVYEELKKSIKPIKMGCLFMGSVVLEKLIL